MDALDRPTIQRSAADLAEEIKTRSADAAAAKLQPFGGAEIAGALLRLSPAFAQDVLCSQCGFMHDSSSLVFRLSLDGGHHLFAGAGPLPRRTGES
jgi:hypothetical protein